MSATRKTALVTGAGKRVGRAIAVHLAGAGYDIAVHYNSSGALAEETAELCRARGARAACFDADLREVSVAPSLVQRVCDAMGGVDALVNSAATMVQAPLDAIRVAQWDAIFAVNLRAPFFLSLAAARVMRDGGAIVNIGDHLADESWPTLVPHGISKAGVIAMTRQLAVQLAPKIRVNAVSPGAVLPPADWPAKSQERFIAETPLRRLGSPDDVAGAVAYLLEATYVTGHILVVDGGRQLR